MKRGSLFLVALVTVMMFAVGCGSSIDKLPTLGAKNDKARFIDAPSLAISPAGYSGKQIKIPLKFVKERTSDKQFYKLLRMNSGTAHFEVYVKRGKFDDFIPEMKQGKEYLVYGRFERDMIHQRNFIYVE